MKLTKTLETLLERAERNGQAVKRVREGSVMDSYFCGLNPMDYREWVKSTPLIEQWRVTFKQDGLYNYVKVFHYGTEIAFIAINVTDRQGSRLLRYYGESASDRDALNGLCDYYGINASFSYRPSIDKFEMVS